MQIFRLIRKQENKTEYLGHTEVNIKWILSQNVIKNTIACMPRRYAF